MIFRHLEPNEVERWAMHCEEVFGLEDAGYFLRHYRQDPTADASLIFVAMDGEEIASTVRVFRRDIWLHGRVVAMGGIGEVSTKPAYRKKGLAAELLQMAIAAMEERGIPVSILFGDQKIYEKAGWRFCAIPLVYSEVAALKPLPGDVIIRPFEEGDLPTLMGLYDLYAGRLDGAVVRSEAYWRSWVLPQWQVPQVLVQNGRPVAYCCMQRGQQDTHRLWAQEIAAAPHATQLLGGFLRALAEQQGCIQVAYLSPLLPDVPDAVPLPAHTMMVRLNSPVEDCRTSDGLVASMQHAGMFPVDGF